MECVGTSTVSVHVSGSSTDEFKLEGSRVIHFHPYFLIVVEKLNVVLKASVEAGLYLGYNVGSTLKWFQNHKISFK